MPDEDKKIISKSEEHKDKTGLLNNEVDDRDVEDKHVSSTNTIKKRQDQANNPSLNTTNQQKTKSSVAQISYYKGDVHMDATLSNATKGVEDISSTPEKSCTDHIEGENSTALPSMTGKLF